jgi:hypothetical protein
MRAETTEAFLSDRSTTEKGLLQRSQLTVVPLSRKRLAAHVREQVTRTLRAI